MKMHFGYTSITVNQRGAHDMAAVAKPRITRDKLKCGDLIFFGPKGPGSSVESIYHAGLYLGRGWFIHSTGSSDGVTLASLNTSSYWKATFAWGRRVLTAGGAASCRRPRRRRPPRRPRRSPVAPSPEASHGVAVGRRHAGVRLSAPRSPDPAGRPPAVPAATTAGIPFGASSRYTPAAC